MKALVLFSSIVFSAVLLGAADAAPEPAEKALPLNAWETPAPPSGWDATSVPITPDRMVDLPPEKEAQALALLQKSAIIPLTAGLYLDLFPGKGFPADKEKQPFLVRGVVIDNIDGGFNAEHKGSDLWIVYAGRGTPGAKKQKPLVFLLPETPKKLYLTTIVNNF